jgi:hypothetical protein
MSLVVGYERPPVPTRGLEVGTDVGGGLVVADSGVLGGGGIEVGGVLGEEEFWVASSTLSTAIRTPAATPTEIHAGRWFLLPTSAAGVSGSGWSGGGGDGGGGGAGGNDGDGGESRHRINACPRQRRCAARVVHLDVEWRPLLAPHYQAWQ